MDETNELELRRPTYEVLPAPTRTSGLRYVGRWLAVAFKHSWGVSDWLSSAIGIGGPLVVRYVPGWQATMNDLQWQIPLAVLSSLFVLRLVMAPYWLYQERDQKANKTEQDLRDQISALHQEVTRMPQPRLVPRYDVDSPSYFTDEKRVKTVITVENRGNADAINTEISPFTLGHRTVSFVSVRQRIVRDGGSHDVTPEILDTTDQAISNDLGLALQDAIIFGHILAEKDIPIIAEIPVVFSYSDLDGRRFETQCALTYKRDERRIFLRYMSSGPVTP